MPGHTYSVVELVGSSHTSLTHAIESAVNRASEAHQGLAWFEVGQIRGQIQEGHVLWYQVDVKIGYRLKTNQPYDTGVAAEIREDAGLRELTHGERPQRFVGLISAKSYGWQS